MSLATGAYYIEWSPFGWLVVSRGMIGHGAWLFEGEGEATVFARDAAELGWRDAEEIHRREEKR